jgi:hypothetical protein
MGVKLLDRTLKPLRFQEWRSEDNRVQVSLRYSWTYLGGGRSSSRPQYWISLDGKPLVEGYSPPTKPTDVLNLLKRAGWTPAKRKP